MDRGDLEQALFGMPLVQLRYKLAPSRRLSRAYELVESGYTDATLKLAAVARRSGIERNYLNRLLRRTIGLTLHQLLIRRRLLEATMRLLATHDAVETIAETCGLGTLRTLERNCVCLFGETPSAFRRRRLSDSSMGRRPSP